MTGARQPVEGFAATAAASTVEDVGARSDEDADVGVAVFPVPLEHAAADTTINAIALRPSVRLGGILSRVIVNLVDREREPTPSSGGGCRSTWPTPITKLEDSLRSEKGTMRDRDRRSAGVRGHPRPVVLGRAKWDVYAGDSTLKRVSSRRIFCAFGAIRGQMFVARRQVKMIWPPAAFS
jgi:hypothetical protein